MPNSRVNQIQAAILAVFLATGCQSTSRLQLSAVSSFEAGDAHQAIASLDEAAEKRGAETDLIAVDKAILLLMNGRMSDSESALRNAQQRIEFLSQRDLTEQTRSVLTDDHAVSWTGREYEQRMIDNLLVLTSLLGDRQDTVAYTNLVMEKVNAEHQAVKAQFAATANSASNEEAIPGHAIEAETSGQHPPPARYAPNAFAAYLQAAVNSERAMNSDLTDRAIRQVGFWTGQETSEQQRVESGVLTAKMGTQTDRGFGTLQVVTFAGRVTDWVEEVAAPTSAALLMADQILSAVGDHTLPPTIAPVKIARPRYQNGQHLLTTLVRTPVAAHQAGVTGSRTIVDLNAAAWDSWQQHRDRAIARAVARRIVKKGAVYAAKDQLSINSDTGIDVLLNVGGIAWEALEKPDKRHITLLPERIDIAQLELPVGSHRVELQTIPVSEPGGNSRVICRKFVDVRIENGLNTFVLCFQPADQLHIVNSSGVVVADGEPQSTPGQP